MSAVVNDPSLGEYSRGARILQRTVAAALPTFRYKLAAALALVASLTSIGVLTLADLPANWRTIGLAAAGSVFVATLTLSALRALDGLARLVEELTVTLDGAWAQVRSLNQEKAEWSTEVLTNSLAVRIASEMHGVVYYKDVVDCTLHLDGAFEIRRDLEMAATVDGLNAIEHYLSAPHAPMSWEHSIELMAVDQDDKSVLLRPVVVAMTAQELYWQLRAVPEFLKGHRIRYTFKEQLPPQSFAMTHTLMRERGLDFEYFYMRISWPTERLLLSIRMPPGFTPSDYSYDVWFGWRGKARHMREYQRVGTEGFWQITRLEETDELLLRLDVRFPVQGLYYAVTWRPMLQPQAPMQAAPADTPLTQFD